MASLLETEKVTITSFADGTFNKGQHEEGAATVIPNVLVNIQPITGQELLQLPESNRERVELTIYSKTEIKNEDIITREIDGLDYEVLNLRNWTAFNLSHFKGMLKRVNT